MDDGRGETPQAPRDLPRVFSIGQEFELNGSRFKVAKIAKRRLILKLLADEPTPAPEVRPCRGIWADDQADLGRGAFEYRHCEGCGCTPAVRRALTEEEQRSVEIARTMQVGTVIKLLAIINRLIEA